MSHSLQGALKSHNKVWQHWHAVQWGRLYIYMVLTCSGNQSPKLGSRELWDMQVSIPEQHTVKQGEGNKG